MKFVLAFTVAISAIIWPMTASGQEGYEFEVYGADHPQGGAYGLDWHLNYVPSSATAGEEDLKSSDHAFRSSFELSHGFNSWFEGSLYATAYARSGRGIQFVGNRARLTALTPVSSTRNLDFGISWEVGHARSGFAESDWTLEVTPILGKSVRRVSVVVNPAFERGIGGSAEREFEFEPRARFAYQTGGDDALSLEYYGVAGPVSRFDPRSDQRHQLFAGWNGEVGKRTEAAIQIGRGFTRKSDRWTIATRLEYALTH
jgi:hypothetical protein